MPLIVHLGHHQYFILQLKNNNLRRTIIHYSLAYFRSLYTLIVYSFTSKPYRFECHRSLQVHDGAVAKRMVHTPARPENKNIRNTNQI